MIFEKDDDINRNEYICRCLILNEKIEKLKAEEHSPRVWASVLINILGDLASIQDKPKECLEQLLEGLKNFAENSK